MGQEPKEFQQGPDGPPVDAYHSFAFQVFFDGADGVEFVELSRSNEIEARYDGVPVLALPALEALEYLTGKAPFNPDDPGLLNDLLKLVELHLLRLDDPNEYARILRENHLAHDGTPPPRRQHDGAGLNA